MKKIKVGNLELSDCHPKICVPVVGSTRDEVIRQAKHAAQMKPDVIEWRSDTFDNVYVDEIEDMLIDLKEAIVEIPLIFTFRTDSEGGSKFISNKSYYDLNVAVAKTGLVDFVDVEAYSKDLIALEMIHEIHEAGACVIGSNHHFDETPSKEEMVNILMSIEELGADVCKLAVMPFDNNDVERLVEASEEANRKMIAPIITMSMGNLGEITRVCCKKTGSVITFAAGEQASAPGQISCDIIKKIFELSEGFSPEFNIWLTGFMGTGKTTVSMALSYITGLQEIDLDSYIVEKEGMSIKDIFDNYGEEYFRDKETESLKEIHNTSGKIISCGGGTVLKDENVQIMKKSGRVILLTAQPEIIHKRVKSTNSRPVLNGNMNVEYIAKLMAERNDYYAKASDIEIQTDNGSSVMTCLDILTKIKSS